MTTAKKITGIICIETKEIFKSQSEAARAKGIMQTLVSRSCRLIKTTHGLNFRFLDENGNPIETPTITPKKGTGNGMPKHSLVTQKKSMVIVSGKHFTGVAKATYVLENGNVYASVWDAADAEEASRSAVSKCCRGVVAKTKDKTFRFVAKANEHIEETMAYIRTLKTENEGYKATTEELERDNKALFERVLELSDEVLDLKRQIADPEYLEWKEAKAKEKEERRRLLNAQMEERREAIKRNEIAMAQEKEILEALMEEYNTII